LDIGLGKYQTDFWWLLHTKKNIPITPKIENEFFVKIK
jgi:hypothetical protein